MLILSPRDPVAKNAPPSAENWQGRVFRIDAGLSSGLAASEVPLVLLPQPQRGAF
jgi:hypothetical protein